MYVSKTKNVKYFTHLASTCFRAIIFRFPVLVCLHINVNHAFAFYVILTFTSDVSLWQFLQERAMDEKVRSGWSNLLLLALRKNEVKGSWRKQQREQIRHHIVKRDTPKVKVRIFYTLLISILIGTLTVNIMKVSLLFYTYWITSAAY